jgi:hypothetical protein
MKTMNVTVCIPSQHVNCVKEEDGTKRCFTVKKYARLGEFLPMDKHILKMLVKRYDRMYIET